MAGVALDGIPVATRAVARDTLGGAAAAAAHLPAGARAALLLASRAAFGHALQMVAAISALVAVAVAVMALVALRRRRDDSDVSGAAPAGADTASDTRAAA